MPYNANEQESELLEFWKKDKTFEKSVNERPENKPYVFYDGPPFATGLPHYGHIVAGLMKDVVPRYWTMQGYRVERVWGWDCHGLPVENIIESDLKLNSKKDIEKLGVDKFNEACRVAVLKYTEEWRKTVERMGRWVDMEHSYKTMDIEYMESVWWVFKELFNKGLIYEGYKAMHICPRCVTPLSNFEVTQGYKDVDDLSVIWKFKLLNEKDPTFVLAWTTTPWSTLSTMGLSIHPDALYVKALVNGEYIIFAKERLEDMLKESASYEVVDEFAGNTLVGAQYEHIVDWYGALPEVRENPGVYHLYAGDYVDPAEGTGIVT